MRISVLSGRSGNSVKAWLRPLAGFTPHAIERVASFFSDIAGGVHSGLLNVATNAVPSTGTITLSSFLAGDSITIGGNQFNGGTSTTVLGSAATFAVLGKTAVTNTGNTVLTGDLGNVDAASISGFPPGTFSGTLHSGDAAAATARTAATAAYTSLAARPTTLDLTGIDLGGLNLGAGVYNFSSTAGLTGTLTLHGSATDVFIFKVGSSLTTATSSAVVLTGGAVAGNVYWLMGASATLGTSTAFKGNIIATTSITANGGAGATGSGSLIALNGAVTISAILISGIAAGNSVPSSQLFSIGASDTITAANAVTAINNAASTHCLVTASSVGSVITLTSQIPGIIGNYIPMAISGHGSVSAATMLNGTEDDCVVMYNGIRYPGTAVKI